MTTHASASSGAVQVGNEIVVEIGAPANGGEFIARHDGQVIFVREAVTGDRALVQITSVTKSFARADIVTVIESGPARREHSCPAAALGGGCCSWSHIDHQAARQFKAEILRSQLSRIGSLNIDVSVTAPLGDDSTAGWRTTARVGIDANGNAGTRKQRSHTVIAGVPCSQLSEPIARAVTSLHAPGYDEAIVTIGADGALHISATRARASRRQSNPQLVEGSGTAAATPQRAPNSARYRSRGRSKPPPAQWEVLSGNSNVERTVGSRTWALPGTAFWQAHRSAPRAYSDIVHRAALSDPPTHAWDLYGGCGVFAGAIVDAVDCSVTVVDTAASAIDSGRKFFGQHVDFHCNSVDRWISNPGLAASFVVLDPPRAGAGKSVIDAVSASKASTIVHIGCDVGNFARDIGLYAAHGYQVSELVGIDSFPGTHHVEAVAVLRR